MVSDRHDGIYSRVYKRDAVDACESEWQVVTVGEGYVARWHRRKGVWREGVWMEGVCAEGGGSSVLRPMSVSEKSRGVV